MTNRLSGSLARREKASVDAKGSRGPADSWIRLLSCWV